jgi:hypothetical protein
MTTARAVICLVREGFSPEAYGLSRVALEAFLSLRYIENKDSDGRAKRFTDYFAKDHEKMQEHAGNIIQTCLRVTILTRTRLGRWPSNLNRPIHGSTMDSHLKMLLMRNQHGQKIPVANLNTGSTPMTLSIK